MITPDELKAAKDADKYTDDDPVHPGELKYTPLTYGDQLLLENLVKNYPVYVQNVGLFPDFSIKIDGEQAAPTDKTYMLRAILEALNNLPEVDADSEGSDKQPGFFSTTRNWSALAQDTLNLFYNVPVGLARQSYGVFNKPVQDRLTLDNILLPPSKTGKRY